MLFSLSSWGKKKNIYTYMCFSFAEKQKKIEIATILYKWFI